LDHTGLKLKRGRVGIYSGPNQLVFKREEPIPGEQIELRARLSILLGSAVLAFFPTHSGLAACSQASSAA